MATFKSHSKQDAHSSLPTQNFEPENNEKKRKPKIKAPQILRTPLKKKRDKEYVYTYLALHNHDVGNCALQQRLLLELNKHPILYHILISKKKS